MDENDCFHMPTAAPPDAATGPGEQTVLFTPHGVLYGVRQALPIALGVFAYGLVFGVLARQAGLTTLEALLMSGLVFAGAAQFVALGLWAAPLPALAIVLTTLVVNLRHVLMGATLRPWFARLPRRWTYLSAFFMVDESWAVTMGAFSRGYRDAAMLVGSGLTVFGAWLGATLAGRVSGSLIDPTRLGLDFAFTAVFLAMLVGMWRGRGDIVPWLVAAIVAVIAARWLPGKDYILAGALAGSLVGALTDEH